MELEALIKEKSLTERELKDSVIAACNVIDRLMDGKRPSSEDAKKIASILGFDWVSFYGDELVRAMREEKKITQQELANEVGVTRQMIGMIERGAKPSIPRAKKIASILGFEWTKLYEKEKPKALIKT